MDTPISVQPQTYPSQPQYVTYVGGPLNGQRSPVTPNFPGPSIPPWIPQIVTGGSAGAAAAAANAAANAVQGVLPNPVQQAQNAAQNAAGDVAGAAANKALSALGLKDLTDWIKKNLNKDTFKGLGLLFLAVLVGTLGLLIFVFAPHPQQLARTGIKSGAKAVVA
jgi:hypothetical protein